MHLQDQYIYTDQLMRTGEFEENVYHHKYADFGWILNDLLTQIS